MVDSLIHLKDVVGYDEEGNPEKLPIDLYVSTYGGSVLEMFSVYDVMKLVRRENTIRTYGLGKVMSAGVLLLASGTRGHRYVGKNCRVMIHSAAAVASGPVFNMVNEMEEVARLQQQYVDCLAKRTNLTKSKIKKLISQRIDVYFSAEEAVKFGIADKII